MIKLSYPKKQPLWVQQLFVHRQGIILGALIGAATAFWAVSAGYDLTTIINSGQALIDNVFSRNAPVSRVAVVKLYAVMISLGMAFGYLFDRMVYFIRTKSKKV